MPELKPERVGVVGGGIMGSGIAALFANQGLPVTLFDVDPAVAARSIAALAEQAKLPQLTSRRHAKRITPAATADYAEALPACDVIVEVVPEVLDLKKRVFAEIDAHRRPGSVVSTNTSGLSVDAMVEGCSADLQRHFLGTHYFHPVRYMPLVELIPHAATDPEVLAAYADFFRRIGKKPVVGRDTPNFIANRVGVYAVNKALALTAKHGLTVEAVDMITGTPLGNPKTATFRLSDMVGIDTLLHATTNSHESCPDDEVREELKPHPWLAKLVELGRLGEKTGAGFYQKVGKGKVLTLDLETFDYRPRESARSDVVRVAKGYAHPGDRVRAMVEGGDDRVAAFSRELVLGTGAYALNRVGEVADDVRTVDDALKWGFGRDVGPIEALDAIGLERAARMMDDLRIPRPALLERALATTGAFYDLGDDGTPRSFDGQGALTPVPQPPRVISLPLLRRQGRVVRENLNARLVDLGDGVLLCEPDVKMVPDLNPLDEYVLAMLGQAHEEVAAGRFRAIVIGNQAKQFCAGANLKGVLELAKARQWDRIEALAASLQRVNLANLHAPYPVVAAPHGMTLGGGLEVALGAQVRVCAQELYCGLVEVGVGLIPAGGGCLRLLQLQAQRRNRRGAPLGFMQNALAAFDLIGYGRVSSSAEDAREKHLLGPDDVVCPSRDELIHRAKAVALERLEGFAPVPPQPVRLPGRGGYCVMEDTIDTMLRAGQLPPHAARIAKVQARVLTGGPDADPTRPTSEEDVLALEREAFVELCREPATQARMAHMLETGKPLMN